MERRIRAQRRALQIVIGDLWHEIQKLKDLRTDKMKMTAAIYLRVDQDKTPSIGITWYDPERAKGKSQQDWDHWRFEFHKRIVPTLSAETMARTLISDIERARKEYWW